MGRPDPPRGRGPLVEPRTAPGLLDAGQRVLVAVSGGGDSVALLHLLVESDLDLDLVVAHLDHRMRPDSADDARFVADLSASLGLPLETGIAEPAPAGETEARRVRHEFLEEAATRVGATAIALGHTLDDQAETVLFRALRGTGPLGLAAMGPRRDAFVRPILGVRRADLRSWLAGRGLPWRDDPSNEDRTRYRAFLRHEILPRFPAATGHLAALASRAGELADFVRTEARRRLEAMTVRPADELTGRLWPPRFVGRRWASLDRAALVALEPALRHPVLARALAAIGGPTPSAATLDALLAALDGAGGSDLPGGVHVLLERSIVHLVLEPIEPPAARAAALEIDRPVEIAPGLALALSLEDPDAGAALDRGPFAAVLAVGDGRLACRPRRPGDRYRPLGAPGAKPLAEVLTDRRIARPLRDALPVVTVDDRPAWFPGLPPDDAFAVRDRSSTRFVVRLVPA